MPRPEPDEDRQAFIARFLADPKAVADYPDPAQRFAVAVAMWERSVTKFSPDQARDDDGKWTDGSGEAGGKTLTGPQFEALMPALSKFKTEREKDAALSALDNWASDGGYQEINSALRSGDAQDWTTSSAQRDIRWLDRTFDVASHQLDQDVVLYRGAGTDHIPKEVGAVFVDRGFVATTASAKFGREIAAMFRDLRGQSLLMKIVVPRGTRVLAVPGNMQTAEVLLRRGTRFEVVGIAEKGSVVTLRVRGPD